MRPVLMVAYYFPPAGGAGVQRTLKFARYLPDHGWQPHVLVPDAPEYPVLDPSLLDEVPDTAVVHRSRIIEPYGLYRRLTGRGEGSIDVATLSKDAKDASRRSERVSEWMRSTFFIPDARVGWYPFAVRTGRHLLRSIRPQAIYSTAPPYTCHLIGRALHRASGLPWIADFRDSWVDWLSAPRRRGLSRRIDVGLEGSVLREASRVLTVSRGVADDLASRHPGVRDARWDVLPNGFDPEDLAGVTPDRANVSPDKLLLTYAGTLYGPRNPDTLVAAFDALVREAHPCIADWHVRLVGRVADSIRARIAQAPSASVFETSGYVSHREIVAQTLGSDALLLIVDAAPQSAGILTGKLFEYLGVGRPILAVAPPGEAREVVEQTGAGLTVSPGDVSGMRAAILATWEAWRAGTLKGPAPERVAVYQRQEQAAALASMLDQLAGADHAG